MTYQISPDEHCVFCYSKDLAVVNTNDEEYRGGMSCVELRCNNCDAHFAVDCDEIMPDGTLLHGGER